MKDLYKYIEESLLDNDKTSTKDVLKQGQLAAHPFLARGKKMRMDGREWAYLEMEADKKFGYHSKTPEYLKFVLNNCIDRVLWKYPEIEYVKTDIENITMGSNRDIPAKKITIWYEYKGKKFSFRINTFFSEITTEIVDEKGKNQTYRLYDKFDVWLKNIFSDKKELETLKKFIETL